jgi:hypothetical protein
MEGYCRTEGSYRIEFPGEGYNKAAGTAFCRYTSVSPFLAPWEGKIGCERKSNLNFFSQH